MSVLELAERLGNVAEACRRCGVTRTQYYQYKRKWLEMGEAGLAIRPPLAKTLPHAKTSEQREKIRQLALLHPASGTSQLRQMLASQGVSISSATLRKYLEMQHLATSRDRWLALERKFLAGEPLEDAQVEFVEGCNPCFRLRDSPRRGFGELMLQDYLAIKQNDAAGSLFVHYVVDAGSMLVFADLFPIKRPEAAISLLHQKLLAFVNEENLAVSTIATNRSPVFNGKPSHLYRVFLQLLGLTHLKLPGQSEASMAPAMRFRRVVREGFFAALPRGDNRIPYSRLRADFQEWLQAYNRTGLDGYPAHGASPLELFERSKGA